VTFALCLHGSDFACVLLSTSYDDDDCSDIEKKKTMPRLPLGRPRSLQVPL
jgi:hypothetical protein